MCVCGCVCVCMNVYIYMRHMQNSSFIKNVKDTA